MPSWPDVLPTLRVIACRVGPQHADNREAVPAQPDRRGHVPQGLARIVHRAFGHGVRAVDIVVPKPALRTLSTSGTPPA